MVRIADILKKAKEKKDKAAGKETLLIPPEQPAAIQPQEQKIKPEEPAAAYTAPPEPNKETAQNTTPKISISSYMSGTARAIISKQEAGKLYKQAVEIIETIFEKANKGQEIIDEDKTVVETVKTFVEQQLQGNEGILNLINIQTDKDFLYYHVINTCIMAVDIGIGMGYGRDRLVELGTAAILHDIGMMKYYDLYNVARKLSTRELNEIKNHATDSAEILGKFKNITAKAAMIAAQHHERADGSGYQMGLKGDAIHDFAKIVRIVDEYEAMTHDRPYRNRYSPYEALKKFIKTKDSFEKTIARVMIKRIATPFPLGSFVKLNSGETGEVIKRNLASSLRPVIQIECDVAGERMEKVKIVDLSKEPSIFIERICSPLQDRIK